MKAIVMNGAGDIDMLEYVERPDPSQPAQPAQPAHAAAPAQPRQRQRRWAAGGQRRRGRVGRREKGLSFSYTRYSRQMYRASSSSNALASWRSAMSKPSVSQLYTQH